ALFRCQWHALHGGLDLDFVWRVTEEARAAARPILTQARTSLPREARLHLASASGLQYRQPLARGLVRSHLPLRCQPLVKTDSPLPRVSRLTTLTTPCHLRSESA